MLCIVKWRRSLDFGILFLVRSTLWPTSSSRLRQANADYEDITNSSSTGIVLFNWVQLGLTVFGLFMVFDPLGSVNYGDMQDTPNQVRHHRKVTGLWSRRFRWAFCWLKRDEHGKEAFQQVAGNPTYYVKIAFLDTITYSKVYVNV